MKANFLAILVALLDIFGYGVEFPISDAAGAQKNVAVAFDGTNYLVVWEDYRNGYYADIYGARVTQAGVVLDPAGIAISTAAYNQYFPDIAFDGTNYLVVWNNYLSNSDKIYGARVSPSGIVLDSTGIPISSITPCMNPAVAFDDTNYLVVWQGNADINIYGRRVSQTGEVLDPSDIPISTAGSAQKYPAVAFDGTNYLVAWDDYRLSYLSWNIYGARVSRNGQVLDPPETGIAINTASGQQNFSSVAFDGTNYLVVWQDDRDPSGGWGIYGARVSPTGQVLDPPETGIAIITAPQDQKSSSVIFDGTNYLIVWEDNRSSNFDIYCARVSTSGVVLDTLGIPVLTVTNSQSRPDIAFDGTNYLVVWEDYRNGVDWNIWGTLLQPACVTDDPLALAYNGNRHLARNPNSEKLHLVYSTHGKIIYRRSSNGGADWTLPEIIGDGKFPAICLSSGGSPSVTWTDEIGGLWYGRKIANGAWDIGHLYDPWAPWQPGLNSPPSIVTTPHAQGDTVHILCTLHTPANGPANWVAEYSFRIDRPGLGSFSYIEGGVGINAGAIRYNPSIAKDYQSRLHAVWQRADTICYATRQIGQTWDNWGPRFGFDGLQSAHPFVETYGDSIFVTWQHLEPTTQKEDVYRGARYRTSLTFYWSNFSQTSDLISLYPVNAWGFFTVYAEETQSGSPFDIFYRINPSEPAWNISNTSAKSIYPQSVARFYTYKKYLYTAWLDGDAAPYEIRFKKLEYVPPPDIAYLSSDNGHNPASPYLVARDSCISNWQIPVDIGYETVTYQFPLEPDYRYKLKAVAYHEGSGEWREWVIIDGQVQHLAKYNPYEPEIIEFIIPPAFYQDSVIEVVFERISGDFASIGPIFIYRYEYEGGGNGGGPMAKESHSAQNGSIIIYPNPFVKMLHVNLAHQPNARMDIKIYDATGRLVKNLYNGIISSDLRLPWNGIDNGGKIASQGIYFLQIKDCDAGKLTVHKVLKVR